MDRDSGRAQVIKAAKLLYARSLLNAFEGNVSCRVGRTLFITPSQVCKEELTVEDLVEVDIETGKTLSENHGRRASSELLMHLCCYRERPDVFGIAHAHPPYATAFALRGQPIETEGYPEMMLLFQKVPVCRYGRPSTPEVCDDIPEALASYDTFLLANHGLSAVGATPMEAMYRLESIESIAKVLFIARAGGGEVSLGAGECESLKNAYFANRGVI